MIRASIHAMASRTYRAEAIVLKTLDFGEADRILTLLTRHFGKVQEQPDIRS